MTTIASPSETPAELPASAGLRPGLGTAGADGRPEAVPSLAAGHRFLAASEYRRRTAAVEIVVPVYDEEATLERSIRTLHAYLTDRFPLPWLITIADNASTDRTWGIAAALHADLHEVQALRLPAKGRGRALRAAWSQSPVPVVAYMDVDLSTDLDALLPLVAPLLSGHSDVAIGTRLAAGSRVTRGPKREAISRTYNLILRTTLRSGFSDAQCGFKAVRGDVARALLPLVEDEGWFFDTELLVLAEHNGLRIHEVPVDWVDDPDSRVDIVRTAAADLRGVGRLLRRFARGQGWVSPTALPPHAHPSGPGAHPAVPTHGRTATSTATATTTPAGPVPAGATIDADAELGGQLVRFASVGAVSTVVFAVLFAALYGPLGAVPAALASLVLCSAANTAANRRLTFAHRGPHGRRRHWSSAAALSAVPVALDLGALAVAASVGVASTIGLLGFLTVANLLATAVRFLGLRHSMGR
jgi:putative flippase GtrA